MDNFEEFANQAGLSEEQKQKVKKYIMDILVENLKAMKDEYNNEIDQVIVNLEQG